MKLFYLDIQQKSSRSSNRELSCYAIRALTEAGLLFPRFFDGSLAGTQWGNKKYMNMKHLEATMDDASIAG